MNYYERIQSAVNFAEQNLEDDITVEDMAKQAYMSVSNFYRLFFAITGFQAKEYIIRRRISSAAADIKEHNLKVIDASVKYAYESSDAFCRAFKKLVGCTPSAYKQNGSCFKFERIDVMEKYFEVNDGENAENYPDIKVIKNLQDMRVAYYCYYGKEPENGAFSVVRAWIKENGLDINGGGYRIFGYNAPDTDPSAEEYGYEICITVPENMEISDEQIKVKTLKGGLYAIVSIDPGLDLGNEIMNGWSRFSKWLDGSKYTYGKTQWLEEHLGFDSDFEHCGGVDLYMPVMLKSELDNMELTEELMESFTAACYTAKGKGAEKMAKEYLFNWAKERGIDFKSSDVRVFSTYNNERIGKPDYWYKMMITVPHTMEIGDKNITIEQFPNGKYLRKDVKYRINGQSWYSFIQYIVNSRRYNFGCTPFLEEYLIDAPCINEETDIAQHMPIDNKGEA